MYQVDICKVLKKELVYFFTNLYVPENLQYNISGSNVCF